MATWVPVLMFTTPCLYRITLPVGPSLMVVQLADFATVRLGIVDEDKVESSRTLLNEDVHYDNRHN